MLGNYNSQRWAEHIEGEPNGTWEVRSSQRGQLLYTGELGECLSYRGERDYTVVKIAPGPGESQGTKNLGGRLFIRKERDDGDPCWQSLDEELTIRVRDHNNPRRRRYVLRSMGLEIASEPTLKKLEVKIES